MSTIKSALFSIQGCIKLHNNIKYVVKRENGKGKGLGKREGGSGKREGKRKVKGKVKRKGNRTLDFLKQIK